MNLPTNKAGVVGFIAHALTPRVGELSTRLINDRLDELGLCRLGGDGPQVDTISWLNFPVVAATGVTDVDFRIIPVYASEFLKAHYRGDAFGRVERGALSLAEKARQQGRHLTLGWGALTKNVVGHGTTFLEAHPFNPEEVATTHGDAGTAALVLQTLEIAAVKPGSRIAVIGANGAIGDLVSCALARFNSEKVVLIGRPDKPGAPLRNRARLLELRQRVLGQGRLQVHLHQDKRTACLEHATNVVIVATNGMHLDPGEVPPGALVLDLCTPAACIPDQDWSERLVLSSGCGELPVGMLPEGFGSIAGRSVEDVGAGGLRVLWGCTIETIVRSLDGRRAHLAGTPIPVEDLLWCEKRFAHHGILPQPPISLGCAITWDDVRRFVAE